jgi:hypothetical protein
MDTHDRYVLLLDMLEGDREARKVLADLLEDEGERSLAQWARRGRKGIRRQLEFSTMLLPSLPALKLGADIIEATLGDVRDNGVRPSLAVVRTWLEGAGTRASMIFFLSRPMLLSLMAQQAPTPPGTWDEHRFSIEVMEQLRSALSHVVLGISEHNASHVNYRHECDALLNIRRIVSQTCDLYRVHGAGERAERNILERMKAILQQLVPS